MKKNKLSVWIFPYRKRYYLTHPWKIASDFRDAIQNFFHRARYGYAYSDVWEWYNWWTSVGAEALRYLAKHGHGYPGYPPWETPEKWYEHLNELANNLEWCATAGEFCNHEEQNEYHKDWEEMQNRTRRTEDDVTWHDLDVKDKILNKKYWAREQELVQQEEDRRAEIFAELGRNLPRYWD